MNYLKEKLKEKGMTQSELAIRCGVSRQYINDYCTDRYKKMNIKIAYDIAKVLDLDIKEFIEEILE